ncbi:MAG: S9 family peptidase [Ignavibacteria bacterium]|jgi:dipeptidyl-peptidase-4|nr:S9 family peptidase [Ignavibacteria bacterium]MDH7527692.1 S9 family peptidase [Ignavibacteria bacterium]
MKKFITLFILIFSITVLAQTNSKKFTLEEIWGSSKFSAQSLRMVKWINGGEKFTYLEPDFQKRTTNIIVYDIKTKSKSVLLSSDELKADGSDSKFTIMNYEFSPDENYILFTGLLPARSIKSGGNVFLYNLKTKEFFQVETKNSVINVKFSPDSKKLGYVKDDNLFVYDIETRTEKQLTFDGNGVIINGHFDWVYEEEFSIIDGWRFSNDGKQIAFWQLDQSPVPEIEIQQFDSLYFNSIKMRYPKAGAHNSIVKIGVVDLSSGEIKWMNIGDEKDIYIPRIYWTTRENELAIIRLNRLQNKLELLLADTRTGNSKVIYTDTDSCWVDVEFMDLYFFNNKKNFLISSERNGFKHFYLYDYSGKLIRQITSGQWEADRLVEVDEKNNLLYFTSGLGNPLIRNLYRVSLDGKGLTRLTPFEGTSFINSSPNFKYFIVTNSSVKSVSKTFLMDNKGKILDTLINNSNLEKVLTEYNFSTPEFITFTTSDGVVLNAMMIKPADFDPEKKYPVLFYNYSGPGSQIVRDIWGGTQYLWHQMLAQEGYIIFMIDNRGTGGRGKAFKNIVYKNLGHWEVNDLVEAAKYLMSLPYVDPERIGIWGWSYGGYISALTILEGNEYFKCAVSVAPVTHWKFYDTIYTERYMSTPELNPEGYEKSAVTNKADKLKGKLLLIHGTADDNVHFQNTVVLVDELIKANKQFNVMFYPGKDHGIAGGKTRLQLFTLITNFIKENL